MVCGSYSMSACSWVRLTATLSTPFCRPGAFSIVPVHSEQCSPPRRARIRDRPGRAEGSSLQSSGALSAVVVAVMTKILSVCRRSRGNGREQAEPDRPGAQRDQDDAGKDREPSGERGEPVEKSPCGRDQHDGDKR